MIRSLSTNPQEPITFDQALDDVEHLALEVLALVDVDELLVDPSTIDFAARRLVRLTRGLRIAAAPLTSGEVAR